MNKERMLHLADVIEGGILRVKFNMMHFDGRDIERPGRVLVGEPIPNCGTACCIAGHACLIFGDPATPITGPSAQRLLGLTPDQTELLFFNQDDYIAAKTASAITRQDAAAAIRRMVAEEGSASVLVSDPAPFEA